MNIFQAIKNPYEAPNPYIYTLMDGINKQFKDINWSWGYELWTPQIYNVDIIHIHWPTWLLKPNEKETKSLNELDFKLKELKKNNVKIIATCHNLEPHYCNDTFQRELYDVVYRNCNLILHLGEYSLCQLKQKLPYINHKLLPHHIYDEIYVHFPKREECIKKLNLSKKALYILCFGAFRNIEENKLVLDIAQHFKKRNIYILAPSYEELPTPKNIIEKIRNEFYKLYLKYKYHIIITGKTTNTVSNDLVPFYYGASNICLIHRKKILNSGNITMAMMMGKIIVGPNIGNVGDILTKINNPTFNINNNETIYESIDKAINLSLTSNLGSINKSISFENLSTHRISAQLYNIYKEILNQ